MKKGIPILDITQCISGSVRMPLYESTDKLSKLGIINGSDITSEAGLTKMMYLLGKKLNLKEIKEAFSTSICGEQNSLNTGESMKNDFINISYYIIWNFFLL